MTDTATTDTGGDSGTIDSLLSKAGGSAFANMNKAVAGEISTAAAKERDPNIIKARAGEEKRIGADEAAIDKARAGIEPIGDRVQPWDAKKELEKDTTNPIETFGSIGMVFAQLASAFTHQPMVNSLNAGAAVMQAVKANDRQRYEDSYDAWKQNTNLAFERHRAQQEDLHDALNTLTTDVQLGQEKLRLYGAKYDDKIATYHAALADYGTLASYAQAQAQLGLQWAQLKPTLQEQHDKQMALFDKNDEWLKTPEGQAWKAKNPTAKGVPPQVELKNRLDIERETAMAKSPYRGQSLSAAEGAAVQEMVDKEHIPVLEAIQRVQGAMHSGALDAKTQAASKVNRELSDELGGLIKDIQADPNIVGTRGRIGRALETAEGIIDPSAAMNTPAQKFESKMTELREKISANITGSKYYSPRRAMDMQRIMPGLEGFTSPQQALNALIQLKEQIDGASTENEQPADSGADYSHLWTK